VHSSDLDRSEVFLETKIWISDYGYDETLHGFEKSAQKLGVDQIDLLILHHQWIRTSGAFDGVFDFDKATRDPQDLTRMLIWKELSRGMVQVASEVRDRLVIDRNRYP
jgi:diketogulonate reductase-like aldo/keto reductase